MKVENFKEEFFIPLVFSIHLFAKNLKKIPPNK